MYTLFSDSFIFAINFPFLFGYLTLYISYLHHKGAQRILFVRRRENKLKNNQRLKEQAPDLMLYY
jgi:hypothetical protein